jgi:hypothetical protein
MVRSVAIVSALRLYVINTLVTHYLVRSVAIVRALNHCRCDRLFQLLSLGLS